MPNLTTAILLCTLLPRRPIRLGRAPAPKDPPQSHPPPHERRPPHRRPPQKSQDLDAQYLLDLQPRAHARLPPPAAGLEAKAQGYGGWDGPGRQLTGHIAGHYLSAISMMYASTGDPRFKERADAFVTELQTIQNAQKDGYIGALLDAKGVDGKVKFEDLSKGEIKSGAFDLNASGPPGTSSTNSSPASATPTTSPATAPPSKSKSSSPAGLKASSKISTTTRSSACWPPNSAA